MLQEQNILGEQFRPRGIKPTKGGRGARTQIEMKEDIGPGQIYNNIQLTALKDYESHVKSEGMFIQMKSCDLCHAWHSTSSASAPKAGAA